MARGAWQATVHGVARVGHNLATKPTNQPTYVTPPIHSSGASSHNQMH